MSILGRISYAVEVYVFCVMKKLLIDLFVREIDKNHYVLLHLFSKLCTITFQAIISKVFIFVSIDNKLSDDQMNETELG